MKLLVSVLALLVSTSAFGAEIANWNKAQRCEVWVKNALKGATRAMQGASRNVELIERKAYNELMADSGIDRNKIYIMTEEGFSAQERHFLEQSTLFGYDAMHAWKSHSTTRGPSRVQWQRNLMSVCLERQAV